MKKRQEEVEKKQRLIAQVKSHACIWDRRLQEHRNRLLIDEAWESIAQEMNTTQEECKKLWKNLTDQFRTNYQEITCQGSGSGLDDAEAAANAVKWAFFKSLLFLKDVFARRETKSNTEDAPACSNISLQGGPSTCSDADLLEDDSPESYPVTASPPSPPVSPAPRCQNSQLKKTKRRDDSETIMENLNAVSRMLAREDSKHQRFADYCAYLMEHVPDDSVRRCEHEVIKVINAFADGGSVYTEELL